MCVRCPTSSHISGVNCVDDDSCSPNPCCNGVNCTDLKSPLDGFECGPYPAGTTGDGVTCVNNTNCNIISCGIGFACLNVTGGTGFRCECVNDTICGQPPSDCKNVNITCPNRYSCSNISVAVATNGDVICHYCQTNRHSIGWIGLRGD